MEKKIMYKIDEEKFKEKYYLLIPAMLDDHFPLLKYAFYSEDYHPVILENTKGIKEVGLRFVNNDMCYPAILNIGQMIGALESGKYDYKKTVLMMPQAGDMCRGSNYISLLRKALRESGIDVRVLSLNVKGLEDGMKVNIHIYMVWRAIVSVIYGDLLMLICNQTRPYERNKDETEKLRKEWTEKISDDLKKGKNLSLAAVWKNVYKICASFRKILRSEVQKKKVGITGELYIRYCSIGNSDLIKTLENENCECFVSGLLWYILYYLETHLSSEGKIKKYAFKTFYSFILGIQKKLIKILRENNYCSMDSYDEYKESALKYIEKGCSVGDGWLMGADIVAFSKSGYTKIIGAQPFGCMVNQVCGKGMYAALSRKLGNVTIASVDFDPGASHLNIINRIMMILAS